MLNFFKNYKKIKLQRDKLLLENSSLLLKLNRFSEADKQLSKILDKPLYELEIIDLSTEGQVRKYSNMAREALSNKLLQNILNNSRYNLIMQIAKHSRDYPEVVQLRASLLFIENTILNGLKKFISEKNVSSKGQEDDL